MLLSFPKRRGARAADAHHESPSTVPGAWRDSAISQLDAIVAANDRAAARRLRGQAAGLAIAGVVALGVAAALVWSDRGPNPRTAPAASSGVLRPAPAAVPPVSAQAAAPVAVPESRAPLAKPASAIVTPPTASVPIVAVPKLRPRAEPAPERERRALSPPMAAQTPPPARRSEPEVIADAPTPLPAAAAAPAARADVRELCAGGGFVAQNFCQSRECRKAEHRADAVCVRLRELEQARERTASDR